MKVVGICGSPRKGNTEWMLRKLLEGANEAGVETELILLGETWQATTASRNEISSS